MFCLVGRLSEHGRLQRLVRSVQAQTSREEALAIVSRELDDRIPELVTPQLRRALDWDVLERVRETKLTASRLTAHDLWAALAAFWLVFFTALPAVLPFLVIRDVPLAMRASNAILIALLFYTGWRWAGHTGASPWRTGLFVALLGVVLVVVAIALGG